MKKSNSSVVVFLGTVFFIGKIPGPGGTIGSFALYVFASFLFFCNVSYLAFNIVFAVLLAVSFVGSVYVGRNSERVFGKPDPNCVVIDEIAGASLTLLFYPFRYQIYGIIILFFVFRFFDIFKPFGIRRLENVGGGYGIVLDDIAAGLAPLLLIQVSQFIIP